MKNTFKSLKIVSFVFMLLLFVNCGGGEDDGFTPVPTRTADDVRADFQNLTINAGINDLTLESVVSGLFWNFRIIAPAGASSTNKRPLIMRLHGGATNVSSSIHQTTDCLAEPGLASLDAYIISPNSNGSHWYTDQNIVQILALVDMVSSYLHVDANKRAVMGYSDGGNGAWFFSQYYSGLFSAAIPMASSYAVTSQSGVTHQFAKPIYAIHGADDDLFPLAITQGYIDETVGVGSDVTFVVAPGLEHFNSCVYVPYLQDAADWLETTVWN
ncbi:MAG: hypothetical protein COA67_08040 [Lutibacter sp.]|nr:MAG: hypothetical protein COA67_08040 [Lutibacter sp.]